MRTKKTSLAALATTLVFAMPLLAQDSKPLPHAVELDYPPTLTVTGRGEVVSAPDRALVRLGTEAQAADARGAQDTVNRAIEKALSEIQKLGIERRAIKTAGLNLYPVYSQARPGREAEEPRVTGYRAANVLEVTLDDLALIGKVIDTGLAAGVNKLEGVSFELRNDLPQRQEALRQAITDGKAKAESIAGALPAKLGKLREVIEGGGGVEMPRPMFARSAAFNFSSGAATSVQPGELRVEATVTLRYELAP